MSGIFLEVASAAMHIVPEYPVGILIYPSRTDVALTSLTATAINTAIGSGAIKGYLQEWNTIAGASVAEKNIERPATGEFELVKEEIPADTYTFVDQMYANKILGKKVTGNTFHCLIIGNLGGVYGEKSLKPATISTMKINFSNKTSNGGFQDLTNEKTVAITARYLFDELGYLKADIETEDITPKIPLDMTVAGITTHTATSIVVSMNLINAKSKVGLTDFTTTTITINATVNGITVTGAAAFANNKLAITLTGTGFTTTSDIVTLDFSTPTHYLDEVKFNIATFLA